MTPIAASTAGEAIDVANHAAIVPADYAAGQFLRATDTGVLWRRATSQDGIPYVHRAVVFGRLVVPAAADAFRGSGTQVPSDQGWAAETETGDGTVTATAGTVTLACVTSGDLASVATSVAGAEGSTILGADFSGAVYAGTAPDADHNAQVILSHQVNGTDWTYYALDNQAGANWRVNGAGATPATTGVSSTVAADIEVYVDTATETVAVYYDRAALPTFSAVLTTTPSAGSAPFAAYAEAVMNAAGTASLAFTSAFGLRG